MLSPLGFSAIFSAGAAKVHDSGELFAGIMIPLLQVVDFVA
jgi:hypothetical protein